MPLVGWFGSGTTTWPSTTPPLVAQAHSDRALRPRANESTHLLFATHPPEAPCQGYVYLDAPPPVTSSAADALSESTRKWGRQKHHNSLSDPRQSGSA